MNGLAKHLCIRMFPEVSSVAHVIQVNDRIEPIRNRREGSMEWSCLKREHKVYAFLARGFTSFIRKDCIERRLLRLVRIIILKKAYIKRWNQVIGLNKERLIGQVKVKLTLRFLKR